MEVRLFSSVMTGCETTGSLFANQPFFFSRAPQPQDGGISRKEKLMKNDLATYETLQKEKGTIDGRKIISFVPLSREEEIKGYCDRARNDCFFLAFQ